ncbi:hypothetical protein DEO23_03100 [Brachybacterium endophyticum]|uniref:Leucine rich repeat variant domain-containing protein n=1 Tax=Brachybacterium endophyticum TaxID=2182385 RepID=A0A2U2RP95_9MICO|nr:hypothetical protein [Brachybacterium endophyticum]PWH07625.1 hypothetical protein DEO23_03100 [Brachybacterium endophyticum]
MNETPRSPAEEAKDPSTPPERLVELTERHPQLQSLILANPSCPDVARQWILASNPRLRSRAEADGSTEADENAQARGSGEPDESGEPSTDAQDWTQDEAGAASGAEEPETRPIDASAAPAPLRPDTTAADPRQDATDRNDPVADPDAESVWGIPPVREERPATPNGPIHRVKSDGGVVPLGPSGSGSGSSPDPAATATLPAVAAGAGAGAGVGTGAGVGAGAGSYDESGDGSDQDAARRRRTWWACGGCLLLALIVVLVAVLGLRAWMSEGDDSYQRDSSSTSAESTSAKPTEEKTTKTEEPDVKPAPRNARDLSAFTAPSGNISCSLEEDSVGCTIGEHTFGDDLEDCSTDAFSIGVAGKEAGPECGTSFGGGSPERLSYGSSAAKGDVACTSESSGITCWNVKTGKGFTLAKAGYQTF